jgi:hypothetical protein
MMVTLADDAKAAYGDYLNRVRASVASAGTASPEDVLTDLREHVDQELRSSEEPVSLKAMQVILERLGDPREWVSAEELPWWRQVLLRVRTGPDGWRLAYASFGVLALGILLGWVFSYDRGSRHDFNWTVMFMFTGLSFVLSRAALAAAERKLDPAQRWLVYPSLVIVYVFVAGAILLWAPIAGGGGGFSLSYDSLRQHPPSNSIGLWPGDADLEVRAGIFAGWAAALAAGAWWSLLAVLLLFSKPRRLVAAMFAPFLSAKNTMRTRWAVVGLVVALVLLLLAGIAAYAAIQWGHVYF